MEQIEADGVSVDAASGAHAAHAPPSAHPAAKTKVPAWSPPDETTPGLTVVEERPAAKPAVYKRWWFWTLVGGAVAAGATAFLLTRPASCHASLGCFPDHQ
jgi:hypothetical protein